TPILKRLQSRGVILRERSKKDERTVLNYLTYEGERLALESSDVPVKAMNRGLMRQDLIEPLLNEARSLLVLLTV
ncbi:MAG: MarR family transcriptional regulator, partial [Deltaproteobacteria bacterium]|nr:MarR family transcriptional regulator [Deltaproteobacteria bacterium]